MKVLSTHGEALGGPFASVTQEGTYLKLSVMYHKYGMKKSVEMELSDEAFRCLALAMVEAMNVPEAS